ncbi:MAG: CapA family protein [Candidatus Adiutrix sp.]|jgi:poly-gamma-glutamate synthesis protein (capsule biosynthesis protein)|nr:CapA family protein [Candidatus Adiutrix sp.]
MRRRDFIKWAATTVAALSVWAAPGSLQLRRPKRRLVTACDPAGERRLTMMATGDIMMHLPVSQSALQPDGHYDFRPHLQYVRPLFRNADLVMGNLETPLAGGPLHGYPAFNGPDELIDSLKWAGFSALTLANNHSLDQGWKGIFRTAEVVRQGGLIYVGAYLSAEDRARARLFSAHGVTVGLTGYTYGVNGGWQYPKGESWRLNFVDETAMAAEVQGLGEAGADFIVVNIHFGDEYHREPNRKQLALAEALFEAGADLIIGHHPHVVQPGRVQLGRVHNGGPESGRAAVFSLGNFLSNQRDRYTDQGLMVTAVLSLDSQGRKHLGPLVLHQTRCIRRVVEGKTTYRVLPVYEASQNPAAFGLTAAEAAFLARDHQDMSRHLVDYQPD